MNIKQKAFDKLPRAEGANRAVTNSKRWEAPENQHDRALLVYVTRGALHCEVDNDIWITPTSGILWLPSGTIHHAYAYGRFESYSVWVESSTKLPSNCCIASVTPLLCELLIKASSFSNKHDVDSSESRILSVIVDEICLLSWENLRLPIPKNPRLRPLIDGIIADPSDKSSSAQWASRFGLSERTMSRLFMLDVGMSLGRWKKQLHITLALQSLANGCSVQSVAFELGYESTSHFITMFKKSLGRPPGQYLTERYAKKNGR